MAENLQTVVWSTREDTKKRWVENFHPFAVSFATSGQHYAIGPVGVLTIAAIYLILGRSVPQWRYWFGKRIYRTPSKRAQTGIFWNKNWPDSSTVDQPTGKYIYTERPSWCATPSTPTTTGKIQPPSHESIWWIVPSSFGSWNSRQPVTLVYHYSYFPLLPPPYYFISD